MALIKCPECGKEISDKAEACPNCGYPINGEVVKDLEEVKDNEKLDEVQVTSEPEEKNIEFDKKEENEENDVVVKKEMSKKTKMAIGVGIGVVVIGGILCFALTGNMRKYDSGSKLMESGNYAEAATMFDTLDDYKDSAQKFNECKYNQAEALYLKEEYAEALKIYQTIDGYKDTKAKIEDCEYQQTVDAQFIKDLAIGLHKRWAYELPEENVFDNSETKVRELINCELDILQPYKDKKFKDSDLEKVAKAYIGALETSKESIKYWNVSLDEASKKWDDAYNIRIQSFKKFVDNGLTMENKEDIEELKDMLAEAELHKEDEKVDKILSEKLAFKADIKEDYGSYTYTFIITNNSDYELQYFGFDVSLYDSDDVFLESQYLGEVKNFKPGDVAKFTTYSPHLANRFEWKSEQGIHYDYVRK